MIKNDKVFKFFCESVNRAQCVIINANLINEHRRMKGSKWWRVQQQKGSLRIQSLSSFLILNNHSKNDEKRTNVLWLCFQEIDNQSFLLLFSEKNHQKKKHIFFLLFFLLLFVELILGNSFQVFKKWNERKWSLFIRNLLPQPANCNWGRSTTTSLQNLQSSGAEEKYSSRTSHGLL